MRINSQSAEVLTKPIISSNTNVEKQTKELSPLGLEKKVEATGHQASSKTEGNDAIIKEQIEQAVSTMNELLVNHKKSSKFVFHEGLDKYYVKLVDSETEETIKEIPPERLLDAFYEMQKLAGMIVDEKI